MDPAVLEKRRPNKLLPLRELQPPIEAAAAPFRAATGLLSEPQSAIEALPVSNRNPQSKESASGFLLVFVYIESSIFRREFP